MRKKLLDVNIFYSTALKYNHTCFVAICGTVQYVDIVRSLCFTEGNLRTRACLNQIMSDV